MQDRYEIHSQFSELLHDCYAFVMKIDRINTCSPLHLVYKKEKGDKRDGNTHSKRA